MAKRQREYCVHYGSATRGSMSTVCGLSKTAATRLVREAKREGSPARVQALAGVRRRRKRRS